MNVSITPQMVEFVQQQVASGAYQSASEVVRAGLRLLQERERERQARLEHLRRELAIGIEQADRGELVPFDAERIKAEGRRRLAQREALPQECHDA